MITKLTTPGQVADLRAGDILKRFPCNCAEGPADTFDETRTRHILTYEVRSIDGKNGMLSLISTGFRTAMLSPAVDIGRLFISPAELVRGNVWWVGAE